MPITTPFFLVAFMAGLILAVVFMLAGVERRAGRRGTTARWIPRRGGPLGDAPAAQTVSIRIGLPALAGFLTAFGAAGYLFGRSTALEWQDRILIAAVIGTVAFVAMAVLVSRWAVAAIADLEEEDERYRLQGHLARVIAAIGADHAGEVVYEVDGVSRRGKAMSLDGAPLASGTEVVIERVEDGVAYVEAWAEVEKRI